MKSVNKCSLSYRLGKPCFIFNVCSLSLQPSSIRGLVTLWTIPLHPLLSSVSRSNLSVDNPDHSLILSIHLFLGFPLALAPGTVPCIISFSRQSPCFLIMCPKYDIFLLLIDSSRFLSTPAVSNTHSFVFSLSMIYQEFFACISFQMPLFSPHPSF